MKSIKDMQISNNLDTNDIYNKIASNEFIEPLNLTIETIKNNGSMFLKYINGKDRCKVCNCFNECTQDLKGYEPTIEKFSNKESFCGLIYKRCNKYEGKIICNNRNKIDEVLNSNIKVTKQRESIFKSFKKIKDDLEKGNNPKGIALCGNNGSGKSFLVYKLITDLALDFKLDCQIVFANELFTSIRSGKLDINYALDTLGKIPVLLLDDIFATKIKTWGGYNDLDDLLLPLLNHRMDNKKLTLITTNRDINNMQDYFTNSKVDEVDANRLLSRIKALCEIHILTDKNFRDE